MRGIDVLGGVFIRRVDIPAYCRGVVSGVEFTLEQYTLREQRPHFIMDFSPRAFFLL